MREADSPIMRTFCQFRSGLTNISEQQIWSPRCIRTHNC
jgi:hypothetical protein